MLFTIIYGKEDLAGKNIIENFKKLSFSPQIQIIEIKKHPIYLTEKDLDKLPIPKNNEFIVFASTHKSEKNLHSLSLHAPGNWRNNDFGGDRGKISNTSAFVLKHLFQKLNEITKQENLADYEITLECTHHGPSINTPCCFIEIGSTEEQYTDKQAGKIIAKTILSLIDFNSKTKNWISAIAIGGPHYCPNFNKIQLNSNYAISHIIPEYSLPLTESILREAEQKTKEQVKEIVLDWKGLGNSEKRNEILNLLNKLNLKHKRTNQIEK
ncbi:MAG: D-aminoacyl-tRNA deacylase [Candidatus Pacearchaeota archaeon]